MSEKVYCKECRHYCLNGIGTVEDCFAIERGENYYSKDGFIHIMPPERNKENNCKVYEKREN